MLTVILAVMLSAQRNPHAPAAIAAALVYVACYEACRRGFAPARHLVVVSLTIISIAAAREPYLTQRPMLAVMVPPIVAMMLTSAPWIVGSALVGLAGLTLRSDFRTPLLEPLELVVLTMCVSGLALARRNVQLVIGRLEAQAANAERARQAAETAAHEAIAERERATKLEAAMLHMQRLESVGRLAGGVAHDFNNLLTVIGASASMAERAQASGSSPAEDLHEIHLAIARASELTKQLLALSRKQMLVKRQVELNQLVSNVERVLSRLIGKSATLTATLSAEPLPVLADAGQLEQVIVNLGINARDAIGSSHGQIELVTRRVALLPSRDSELEGLPGGDYACVEVRDTGAGMSADVQRRLFEPFFTTKAQGRGTGLGLATSFGIVRQHEGSIRVDSEQGRGTTMKVLLPLAEAVETARGTSGVRPVASKRRRVLVVEDEPQVRAIAVRALAAGGFEVLQAANGAVALKWLKEQTEPIDVLVTDVVMPELSGLELARAARDMDPSLELVFMSGFPEAMQDAHSGEFAQAAFLTKPFSPQMLVQVVRESIERRSSPALAHGTES
ncbi:MAG TPA: ATP-binding protein [Polyangiaceae bacterium]